MLLAMAPGDRRIGTQVNNTVRMRMLPILPIANEAFRAKEALLLIAINQHECKEYHSRSFVDWNGLTVFHVCVR